MPRASKLCRHCSNLMPCPDHPVKAWASSTRSRDLPGNWAKLRIFILERDPICTACHASVSREVHHTGAKDDHRPESLAGICVDCHKRKTSEQAAGARRLNK